MENYVNVSVHPIPKSRVEEYRALANTIVQVYKDHGAIDYREYILEDNSTVGLPFTDMAKASEDETVVVSVAVFASKEARKEAHRKIEVDPRAAEIMDGDHPYLDYPRTAFGGFEELTSAS